MALLAILMMALSTVLLDADRVAALAPQDRDLRARVWAGAQWERGLWRSWSAYLSARDVGVAAVADGVTPRRDPTPWAHYDDQHADVLPWTGATVGLAAAARPSQPSGRGAFDSPFRGPLGPTVPLPPVVRASRIGEVVRDDNAALGRVATELALHAARPAWGYHDTRAPGATGYDYGSQIRSDVPGAGFDLATAAGGTLTGGPYGPLHAPGASVLAVERTLLAGRPAAGPPVRAMTAGGTTTYAPTTDLPGRYPGVHVSHLPAVRMATDARRSRATFAHLDQYVRPTGLAVPASPRAAAVAGSVAAAIAPAAPLTGFTGAVYEPAAAGFSLAGIPLGADERIRALFRVTDGPSVTLPAGGTLVFDLAPGVSVAGRFRAESFRVLGRPFLGPALSATTLRLERSADGTGLTMSLLDSASTCPTAVADYWSLLYHNHYGQVGPQTFYESLFLFVDDLGFGGYRRLELTIDPQEYPRLPDPADFGVVMPAADQPGPGCGPDRWAVFPLSPAHGPAFTAADFDLFDLDSGAVLGLMVARSGTVWPPDLGASAPWHGGAGVPSDLVSAVPQFRQSRFASRLPRPVDGAGDAVAHFRAVVQRLGDNSLIFAEGVRYANLLPGSHLRLLGLGCPPAGCAVRRVAVTTSHICLGQFAVAQAERFVGAIGALSHRWFIAVEGGYTGILPAVAPSVATWDVFRQYGPPDRVDYRRANPALCWLNVLPPEVRAELDALPSAGRVTLALVPAGSVGAVATAVGMTPEAVASLPAPVTLASLTTGRNERLRILATAVNAARLTEATPDRIQLRITRSGVGGAFEAAAGSDWMAGGVTVGWVRFNAGATGQLQFEELTPDTSEAVAALADALDSAQVTLLVQGHPPWTFFARYVRGPDEVRVEVADDAGGDLPADFWEAFRGLSNGARLLLVVADPGTVRVADLPAVAVAGTLAEPAVVALDQGRELTPALGRLCHVEHGGLHFAVPIGEFDMTPPSIANYAGAGFYRTARTSFSAPGVLTPPAFPTRPATGADAFAQRPSVLPAAVDVRPLAPARRAVLSRADVERSAVAYLRLAEDLAALARPLLASFPARHVAAVSRGYRTYLLEGGPGVRLLHTDGTTLSPSHELLAHPVFATHSAFNRPIRLPGPCLFATSAGLWPGATICRTVHSPESLGAAPRDARVMPECSAAVVDSVMPVLAAAAPVRACITRMYRGFREHWSPSPIPALSAGDDTVVGGYGVPRAGDFCPPLAE